MATAVAAVASVVSAGLGAVGVSSAIAGGVGTVLGSAIVGGVSGGVISGAVSELTGGEFKDGFKEGGITGAIGGAVLGAGSLMAKAGKTADTTAKVADAAEATQKGVEAAEQAGMLADKIAGTAEISQGAGGGVISPTVEPMNAGGMISQATEPQIAAVGGGPTISPTVEPTASYATGLSGQAGQQTGQQAGGLVGQAGEQASSGGWLDSFLPKSDFGKEAMMTIGGNVISGLGQAYQQNEIQEQQESDQRRMERSMQAGGLRSSVRFNGPMRTRSKYS